MFDLIFLVLLLTPQGMGLPELEKGLTQRYSRLNDFSADFVQIQQDSLKPGTTRRGHVYLKSGKRMLFQYEVPERKYIYSDGKTYTEYYPAPIAQAVQRPVKEAEDERLAVFLIPWNREWRDQFEKLAVPAPALERPVNPRRLLMELHPRKPDEIPLILLEVDPATFLVHRFVLKYPDGVRNEFRFENIDTRSLGASLFEFKAPPGVEVIREDR